MKVEIFLTDQINITIVNYCGGIKIYDVIVIGTGAGGATVAKDLSQNGKNVLILEKGSRQDDGSYVKHMKVKEIHLKNNLSAEDIKGYEFLSKPLELTNIEEIGGTTISSIGSLFSAITLFKNCGKSTPYNSSNRLTAIGEVMDCKKLSK